MDGKMKDDSKMILPINSYLRKIFNIWKNSMKPLIEGLESFDMARIT